MAAANPTYNRRTSAVLSSFRRTGDGVGAPAVTGLADVAKPLLKEHFRQAAVATAEAAAGATAATAAAVEAVEAAMAAVTASSWL